MSKFDLSPVDLLSPTLEATILSGASGLLAQSFTAYKQQHFSLDFTQIFQFIVFSAITTPPNYAFQYFLEATFPARTAIAVDNSHGKGEKEKNAPVEDRLSIQNTTIKFFLDQSIAATVNTAMYICLLGGIKGHSYESIIDDLYSNFWSLLFASYRFWPFVCLLNFAVIPMRYRAYVGTAAGMIWAIFLSLRGNQLS
ncbi:hypothetical protein CERZMDRAFT_32175 [Cercospora zeae-maydis SCOH1-5]|uniref:Uncharacterized protein n=1 Tax=Cercospora zeae-maydis SCOH1-5 TaxID=717836 RepID=A0A6A6FVC0_9PEZI|nr:hypothetical protein CERZMDRAFT_32175 [Cercospora zeae-maydis SCOH1-5]